MPRNRAWADIVFCGATIADEASVAVNLLTGAASDTITVARILLELKFYHFVTLSADGENCISLGIGVSSSEAFDQLALPDPAVNGDYPPRGWLYVANMVVLTHTVSGGIATVSADFSADVHGMRKVDKGRLFLAFGNNAIVGTSSVNYTGRIRSLCLT